jgi:predicted transcriptional regulator
MRKGCALGTWEHMFRSLLPDFCWQTSDEIVSMFEQINEDASEMSIRVTLSRLKQRGLVETQMRTRIPALGFLFTKDL